MPLIAPGERAPDFSLARADGDPVRFYGSAGGVPTAVLFSGGAGADAIGAMVAALGDELPSETPLHVVARAHGPAARWVGFHDADGQVHDAYGVTASDPAVVVVLDPNLRVLTAQRVGEPQRTAAAAAEVVTAGANLPDDTTIGRYAPVLRIPNVLGPELCARVIGVWERSDPIETGVESSQADGRAHVLDTRHKRRRDHTVEDAQLLRTLTREAGSRIMPELEQAFVYRANRFEGFKIGCYEAVTGGFFAAHRDNLSPATAHRRFGLTLNLNDDYEGGELRFPEYGLQRYRPDAGEALVFSGSLLHEVLPVTRGRRFVLLSFVFGDDAVRRDAPRPHDRPARA